MTLSGTCRGSLRYKENEYFLTFNCHNVQTVWMPKSGGVVPRGKEQRAEGRDQRVKQYFYGPHNNLFPHSFEVNFSDIKDKLYKIGAPELPDSCLPLGMKITDNKEPKCNIVNFTWSRTNILNC